MASHFWTFPFRKKLCIVYIYIMNDLPLTFLFITTVKHYSIKVSAVTILKCNSVALTTFTMLCNHHHSLVAELSITPNGNLVPNKPSLHCSPPLSPWQPLMCFLSLLICLFWIFHLNGLWFIGYECVFVSGFFYLVYF